VADNVGEQIVDLGPGGRSKHSSGLALEIARDRTTFLQHVFTDNEANALLVLTHR
jgi:hypothetical protein